MTQYFDAQSGAVLPVTVIKADPMVVTQIKSAEGKDKYNAVQVGVGKKKKVSKSLLGHLKDLGTFSVLAEFRVPETKGFERGKKIDISGFQVGEMVNAIGVSKGRGFAGFPASHGHNKPRSVGSIGQRFPQHTRRGLRMAGHMGAEQVTVKNLQVVEVDAKRNLISVKGALPGHRNAIVKLVSTGKVKQWRRISSDNVKENENNKTHS